MVSTPLTNDHATLKNEPRCEAPKTDERTDIKKEKSFLREIESLDQQHRISIRRQDQTPLSKRVISCYPRSTTLLPAEDMESDVSSICSEDDEDEMFLCTPSSKRSQDGKTIESSFTPINMGMNVSFTLTPKRPQDLSLHAMMLDSPMSSSKTPLPLPPPVRRSSLSNKRKRQFIAMPPPFLRPSVLWTFSLFEMGNFYSFCLHFMKIIRIRNMHIAYIFSICITLRVRARAIAWCIHYKYLIKITNPRLAIAFMKSHAALDLSWI